jgi:peptide chain release factor 1
MSKSLIPKLEAIKQRYNEVADLIIQPDVITDQKRYSSLNKEYSDLGKIVKVFDAYKAALDTIAESDEIIADGSDKDSWKWRNRKSTKPRTSFRLLKKN